MNRNFIVGLFVITALALFMAGIVLIGNRHEAFARHAEFYAEFKNLGGLAKGAKVQVGGMDAGQVTEIQIPLSPSSKFRIRLRIDEQFHGLVRTDSIASIGTEGIVGETFLLISPGGAASPAAPLLYTLTSKEPVQMSDLVDQAKLTIADVDATVKNANGLVTNVGGSLVPALNSVRTTVGNVNDVVVGLKDGKGAAGMLLSDPAFAGQIRETIANTQGATHDLQHAAAGVDALVGDIQSRKFPEKIDETLANVKDATQHVDSTVQQIHQTVTDLTGPDEQGETAGVNLRETISNANLTTANMAEETEALKHNFLLRGFFRHRGYFNLTTLSPEKYRNDRTFTNPHNQREWVSADQLFYRDANGVEQLSSEGKALLNSTIARFGDSIVASPVVVEGYCDAQSADQLAIAHHRAILVRSYIQNRFQLTPSMLGAVALGSQAPNNSGHSSWDGISVVVLSSRQ